MSWAHSKIERIGDWRLLWRQLDAAKVKLRQKSWDNCKHYTPDEVRAFAQARGVGVSDALPQPRFEPLEVRGAPLPVMTCVSLEDEFLTPFDRDSPSVVPYVSLEDEPLDDI